MADSAAVQGLQELIRKYLDNAKIHFLRDEQDRAVVPFDHIMVYVSPHDWGDDQTVVNVTAVTNQNMRVDAGLMEFLATENARILFGKLCYYTQWSQVRFEHPLLGDFLNQDELTTAVKVVAVSALEYEGKIKEKWGGD